MNARSETEGQRPASNAAQGNALGQRIRIEEPCRGGTTSGDAVCLAPTGLALSRVIPRALPWAGMDRTVGAAERNSG